MKKNYILLAATLLFGASAFAQDDTRNCGSMEVLEKQLRDDPGMARRLAKLEEHTANFIKNNPNQRTGAVIRIPVVVHVVYNTSAQNVSDAMIQAQINVLTQDFRKLNADANKTPSHFAGLAADCNIEFCLATVDPNGNATNGITRTYTKTHAFSTNDAIKYTSAGGKDAWPANQYMNLWVGNLGRSLLGYAQFPGGPAATDGVVVLYSSLPGGSSSYYNKGRTATHEVGHWLNLRHIWGDAACGNDLVSDTPLHNTSNGGCPAATHRSTCTGTPLEMWMNYMDYTYDACMYMFTTGQSTRMNAVLAPGGARYSLLTSPGCGTAAVANGSEGGDGETTTPEQTISARSIDGSVTVYPNPVTADMNIRYTLQNDQDVSIAVYNLMGARVATYNLGSKTAGNHTFSVNLRQDAALSSLPAGMYVATISGEKQQMVRFMVSK